VNSPGNLQCRASLAVFISILKMSFPATSQTQTVWVRKDGNDATGDGSVLTPYLTVAKALSVITDAAGTKYYIVAVGPGRFDEAAIALKPNVWIVGSGGSAGGATRLTAAGNFITAHPDFALANGRAGLANLYLSGSTGLNLDLVALGGVAASRVFELNNVGMNGPVIFRAKNEPDFVDWVGGRTFGACVFSSGSLFIKDVYFIGSMTADSDGPVELGADFVGCFFSNGVNVTAGVGGVCAARFRASSLDGAVNITGNQATASFDAGSKPSDANLNIIDGGVEQNMNDATALDFADGGNVIDWPDGPPGRVHDAIAQLAARDIARQTEIANLDARVTALENPPPP